MCKKLSDFCFGCYKKHTYSNSTIYTDQYGKTVAEVTTFATVVYNRGTKSADVYCNTCGCLVGSLSCSSNTFWNYVHDITSVHNC